MRRRGGWRCRYRCRYRWRGGGGLAPCWAAARWAGWRWGCSPCTWRTRAGWCTASSTRGPARPRGPPPRTPPASGPTWRGGPSCRWAPSLGTVRDGNGAVGGWGGGSGAFSPFIEPPGALPSLRGCVAKPWALLADLPLLCVPLPSVPSPPPPFQLSVYTTTRSNIGAESNVDLVLNVEDFDVESKFERSVATLVFYFHSHQVHKLIVTWAEIHIKRVDLLLVTASLKELGCCPCILWFRVEAIPARSVGHAACACFPYSQCQGRKAVRWTSAL